MDNEQLVKSIRQLCKNRNIAISQLENDLNFGAGLISRWSKNSPSIDKIVDIANYFHVSIDEVVGYNNIVNDKFLEKLIAQTEEQVIQWNVYDNKNEDQPKQYFGLDIGNYDFLNQADIDNFFETHKEKSYFCKINSTYISIYVTYDCNEIFDPQEIKLFIQTSLESKLIEQNYSYEQLKVLWLKVLYTMGDKAPDEVKVEEFKNDFVLNNSKLNSSNTISKKSGLADIQELMSNPEVLKLIEVYNQPAFREMQKTLNNPEVQNAIQIANKLQSYFDK